MSASKQILLVDDDQGIRDLVTLALADEGLEVIGVHHGGEALEVIRQSMPALILLDTRMPVMDGPAFSEAYEAFPEPRAPIVLMTASADAETIMKNMSADAVLAKPFDLDDLLSTVQQFLAKD